MTERVHQSLDYDTGGVRDGGAGQSALPYPKLRLICSRKTTALQCRYAT